MNKRIYFITVFYFVIFSSCNKDKPHGPYDPSTHLQKFSAKIDDIIFSPDKITVASPINLNGNIGIIADDLSYLINIEFPINCGIRTFYLPTEPTANIMMNNINCKSGILYITKYDFNLVEGVFEFDVDINNSSLHISDGYFSIVYRLD